MNQDVIQLNIESESDSFLKKLYSPLGELSRRDYFWCAFFIFIPCKVLVFCIEFTFVSLALQFEFISPEITTKLRYLVIEALISLVTFVYPYFIIVVKRLRFAGYKSGGMAFLVFVVIFSLGIVSILDLDLKILIAVYFIPPSILLFRINGK